MAKKNYKPFVGLSSSSLSWGGSGNGFLAVVDDERTERESRLVLALSSSFGSGLGTDMPDFIVTSVGQGLHTNIFN